MSLHTHYILGDKTVSYKDEKDPYILLIKDQLDSKKDKNNITTISGKALEKMSDLEIANSINSSIEAIPGFFKNLFLSDEFTHDFVEKFYSDNYNKLTFDEKKKLFIKLNNFVSDNLQNNLILAYPEFLPFDDLKVEFNYRDNNDVCISDKFLNKDNVGLTSLKEYIKGLSQYLISKVIDGAYSCNVDPKLLNKKALAYYQNLQTSYLTGSWNNLLNINDDNYQYQPIVSGPVSLTHSIEPYYIKYLYHKFKHLDSETASFMKELMDYQNDLPDYKKNVKKTIKNASDNIMHFKDIDLANYSKYIDKTTMDLSKCSDQEFYELFNSSYENIVDNYDDTKFANRLSNLSNELLTRELKDYDTSKIDLPIYSCCYDSWNEMINLTKTYKDGRVYSQKASNSQDVFLNVLEDIINISVENGLFQFKDEKEKNEYLMMLDWKKNKNTLDYANKNTKFIEDNFNIINIKIDNLISNLDNKINNAIENSKLGLSNKSMIPTIKYEIDAYMDYYEFKNLKLKDEIKKTFNDISKLYTKNKKELTNEIDKNKSSPISVKLYEGKDPYIKTEWR